MNQRDKLLLTLAAVVGVLAAGWFGLVAPKRADAVKLDEQITTAQTALAGTSSRAAQYRAARKSLLSHPELLRRAGTALPTRADMPDLLRSLTRTARESGVKVGNITTSNGTADASTPGVAKITLQLSFTGQFIALERYLSRLHRFVAVRGSQVDAKGRLLSLDSVQLGRESSALNAKVAASVYVLQPGGLSASAATTTATPGATATTPGTPSTTTPAAPAAASTPTAGATS